MLGFAGWRRVGLGFGLGALMALGQAPWGLWWLAVPALALLLHRLARQTAPHAAWLGWFAGAGYFAVALNWIISPFLVDAARHAWMAPFALLLMAFGLALFWAAACGLALRSRAPLLALVTALASAELARGYVLTGFPWALIGHIWIDLPPAQVAALVGPSGLTVLTLAAAGLAASLRPALVATGTALIAALWGFGAWQLAQPDPAAPGIILRLVQPNAPQGAKWDPDLAQLFFDRLMRATAAPDTVNLGKVDLVIWPETALPYLIVDNPDLPAMIGAAARGASVAIGHQRVEGGRGWNTLQVFDPKGALLASYDKHHLVPFGEYIPLADTAPDWLGLTGFSARTGNAYSAGAGPMVLDLGRLGRVLPLICYEAVFPQDLRATVRPDWLLQITNDAWFGTRSGPFQHAAQARLRAVEQGLPLVRVANTGVTQVTDARGRITAALPFGTEGYLDAALPGPLPATPYARYGEIPLLVWLGGCWALIMIKGRRRLA